MSNIRYVPTTTALHAISQNIFPHLTTFDKLHVPSFLFDGTPRTLLQQLMHKTQKL